MVMTAGDECPVPLPKWGLQGVAPCFASNLPFIPSFIRRGNLTPGVRENLMDTPLHQAPGNSYLTAETSNKEEA